MSALTRNDAVYCAVWPVDTVCDALGPYQSFVLLTAATTQLLHCSHTYTAQQFDQGNEPRAKAAAVHAGSMIETGQYIDFTIT